MTELCFGDEVLHHYISQQWSVTVMIGCREFLVECARKVGVEGAAEFLDEPNNGLNEVIFLFLLFCSFGFSPSSFRPPAILEY